MGDGDQEGDPEDRVGSAVCGAAVSGSKSWREPEAEMPIRSQRDWFGCESSIHVIMSKCVRALEVGAESQCFIFMNRTGLCLWEAQRGQRAGQSHTALASDQRLSWPGFLLLLFSQPLFFSFF